MSSTVAAQPHCAHCKQAAALAAFACPNCQSRRYCSAASLEAGACSRRHRKGCPDLAFDQFIRQHPTVDAVCLRLSPQGVWRRPTRRSTGCCPSA